MNAPPYVLAVDAMGGDGAPGVVIDGLRLAKSRLPDTRFLVFGSLSALQPLVERHPSLRTVLELREAETVVSSEMKPSHAMRLSKTSSMGMAIESVHSGEAAAVLSAGNTGALMALAKLRLGMFPGIKRPAIASFFPNRHSESVMLDLGANVECDAENLVQFARLGHVFGRCVLGWERPSIGLLNVGAEGQKGRDSIKEAALILTKDFSVLNYHGFVEGNDIAAGTVDIIVTDGFTGNIALKTAEGTASLISSFIRETFRHSLLAKTGYLLAAPAFHKLKKRIDPRRYNGAVFLGLPHIVVKSHGGTDALGFAAAVELAADMMRSGYIQALSHHFKPCASSPTDATEAVDA
jgi:phosphate acyltransferase